MRKIFGHYVSVEKLALAVTEALLVTGIFCLGVSYFLGRVPLLQENRILLQTSLGALAIVGVLHSTGLTDNLVAGWWERAIRYLLLSMAIFFTALLLATFLERELVIISWREKWQLVVGITATSLLTLIVSRAVFFALKRRGAFSTRIFVLGDQSGQAKVRSLIADTASDLVVVGELEVNSPASTQMSGDTLLAKVLAARASEVVVLADRAIELRAFDLLQCKFAGIKVTEYPRLVERERQMIDPDSLTAAQLLFSDNFKSSALGRVSRRAFDIAIGILGFVASAPVMALAAAAIKLEDGGPIFYRQERVGLNGRPFMILKFRSMITDAEKDSTPRWAGDADSRITRVGRILRTFRIDELPQFFNLLRGDMAFIGPRPERPFFVARLAKEIPFYHERHTVKPGITGWAQVSYQYGASVEDARCKQCYDLYYLKNQSLFLDIAIVVRTIRVILRPSGVR